MHRERTDNTGLWVALIIGLIGLSMLSKGEGEAQDDCPDGTCPAVVVESLADVPPQLRQPNYSPYGSGSCVHASTVTILRWLGEFELAEWWRTQYHSGEYATRLIQRLELADLNYAYVDDGSVEFLEWAARNRRVIGIFYFPKHAVNLVNIDSEYAYLLDNNRPDDIIRVPRDEFITNWQTLYGGFAWTILNGKQPPPYPA